MKPKLKDWTTQIGIGIVYSLLGGIAGSLAFIFFGRQFVAAEISLENLIQTNFFGLFIIFFLLALPLATAIQAFNLLTKSYSPKNYVILSKLRSMSLDKRQQIVSFTERTAVCCFIICLFLALMLTQESLLDPSYKSPLVNWLLPLYFSIICLGLFGKYLIGPNEWTQYYMQNYKKTRVADVFEKALRSYNKALGSSLSLKRIVAISQYVKEAYKIGNEEEVKALDSCVDKTLNSLEASNTPEIDDNIIALSELSEGITKEHQKTLGFEPRYPIRIILSEKLRSSTEKIFPQIIIILAWIGILLILGRFGVVNITLPP